MVATDSDDDPVRAMMQDEPLSHQPHLTLTAGFGPQKLSPIILVVNNGTASLASEVILIFATTLMRNRYNRNSTTTISTVIVFTALI